MKAGKTTVGRLLAERLGLPFVSLDACEQRYALAAGFDPVVAASIREREGDWAWYGYRRRYFAAAVVRFLAEHPRGVLELGGGHPILPDPADQTRVERAVGEVTHVVLLLPSADRGESLRVLRRRQRPEHLAEKDWNEVFMADDRYERMATVVVYTAGRTVGETCGVVVAVMAGVAGAR